MGKISDIVPPLYFSEANDLVRFLESLDVNADEIEKSIEAITDLIDVDRCPDDKLPYLAYLTGCPLPGNNPKIHRRLLRDWPYLLKIKGSNLSLDLYLNSIGALDHKISEYFRDADGNYVEDKPKGEPFELNGTWYNIRTHYFGIDTVWNNEYYTRAEEWHEEFVECVSWWLRRMKPFHAELLRWHTVIEQDRTMDLYHGAAVYQGFFHDVTMNRRRIKKMDLNCGILMRRGKVKCLKLTI